MPLHFDRDGNCSCTDGERTEIFPPGPDQNALIAAFLGPQVMQVPDQVSTMQLELALAELGELDNLNALITAAGPTAEIYWRRVTIVHRDHQLVQQMQAARGWTEAQVDDLFRLAVTKS